MIAWLMKNREWLFSGFGLAILVPVVKWVWAKIHTRNLAIPPFDQSIFRTHPLPRELQKEIDSGPLIHRSNRANEIVGLKVQWKTKLKSVSNRDEGQLRLMMQGQEMIPWVNCSVPKEKYPDLLLAKDNTTIWVAGKLESYEHGAFEIEEAELKIILEES